MFATTSPKNDSLQRLALFVTILAAGCSIYFGYHQFQLTKINLKKAAADEAKAAAELAQSKQA